VFLEPQKIHLFRTKCASWSKAEVLSDAKPTRRFSKHIEHSHVKKTKNINQTPTPERSEGQPNADSPSLLTAGLRQPLYTCRENSTNPPFLCKTNPIYKNTKRSQTLYLQGLTPNKRLLPGGKTNPKRTQTNPIEPNFTHIQSQNEPNFIPIRTQKAEKTGNYSYFQSFKKLALRKQP